MLRWLLGVGSWTVVVLGLLLFWNVIWPWAPTFEAGCWRLVDAPPSCLDQLAEVRARQWWTSTLPFFVVVLGGYGLVAVAAVRSRRRSRT